MQHITSQIAGSIMRILFILLQILIWPKLGVAFNVPTSWVRPGTLPLFVATERTAEINGDSNYSLEVTAKATEPVIGPLDSFLEDTLKETEPVLPIQDIQGDFILGFNKRFTTRLVLDLKDTCSPSAINATKIWIKKFAEPGIPSSDGSTTVKITSLQDVIDHRSERRLALLTKKMDAVKAAKETVLANLCFSYNCIDALLVNTTYEDTLREFSPNDPFSIGAWERSSLLGDDAYREDGAFGKDRNNDLLINLASDSEGSLDEAVKVLKDSFSAIFKLVDETLADRGEKDDDPLYGHEHFGFQDGLSQPEVRGTYIKKDGEKAFIVKRNIQPSTEDNRYMDFSKPGFRLLDAGHFVLGQEYLDDATDANDKQMANPNPDAYRKLTARYPSWCKGGTFAVYRKIKQVGPVAIKAR
jgi:hypothetical protein